MAQYDVVSRIGLIVYHQGDGDRWKHTVYDVEQVDSICARWLAVDVCDCEPGMLRGKLTMLSGS
jgi:hypothetical protein